MQFFTFFDARVHRDLPGAMATADTRVVSPICVIPATAGLGLACHHAVLPAAQRYPLALAQQASPQWWACLDGGVRVIADGREVALLTGGDIFVPQPGLHMEMETVLDSVLVSTVAQSLNAPSRGAGFGEFAALGPDEADWGERLHACGLVWAACHHGALCLQWRNKDHPAELHTDYLPPGTAFAPSPGDDYCIDALSPATGLLCCTRPPGGLTSALAVRRDDARTPDV